jgi:hypothetical protein
MIGRLLVRGHDDIYGVLIRFRSIALPQRLASVQVREFGRIVDVFISTDNVARRQAPFGLKQ